MASEWVDYRAVKQVVSFEQVLGAYRVEGLRSQRRGQLQGRCPIHRGRRVDAFHVSLSQNMFQCFACQAHGNVLDFVAAMEQCSVHEAARRLAHRFGIDRGSEASLFTVASTCSERDNWLGKNEAVNQPLSFVLRGVDSAHSYVTARGITAETAAQFGVGYYGGPGLMRGRVVIPIHDSCGQLVAYAGRSINGELPKYRLPPGFHKSQVLFNFHRRAACRQAAVVVVEGYFDCLKVHQAGYPSVVALMGTVLSKPAESLLVKRFRRVILMLDGDASGRQAAKRIARQLTGKCSLQLIAVSSGRQPDELASAEIAALLDPRLGEGEENR